MILNSLKLEQYIKESQGHIKTLMNYCFLYLQNFLRHFLERSEFIERFFKLEELIFEYTISNYFRDSVTTDERFVLHYLELNANFHASSFQIDFRSRLHHLESNT